MQTALLPSAALAEFYRFTLLLTGDATAAGQVMAETLAEAEAPLGQIRKQTSRHAWLALRLREKCLKREQGAPSPPLRPVRDEAENGLVLAASPLEDGALVARFHLLPEPERSALALFYLEFFTIAEIAELLKMSVEVLSETLGAARGLLHHALREAGAVAAD